MFYLFRATSEIFSKSVTEIDHVNLIPSLINWQVNVISIPHYKVTVIYCSQLRGCAAIIILGRLFSFLS